MGTVQHGRHSASALSAIAQMLGIPLTGGHRDLAVYQHTKVVLQTRGLSLIRHNMMIYRIFWLIHLA